MALNYASNAVDEIIHVSLQYHCSLFVEQCKLQIRSSSWIAIWLPSRLNGVMNIYKSVAWWLSIIKPFILSSDAQSMAFSYQSIDARSDFQSKSWLLAEQQCKAFGKLRKEVLNGYGHDMTPNFAQMWSTEKFSRMQSNKLHLTAPYFNLLASAILATWKCVGPTVQLAFSISIISTTVPVILGQCGHLNLAGSCHAANSGTISFFLCAVFVDGDAATLYYN